MQAVRLYNVWLRLLRPVLHMGIIVAIFFLLYRLRHVTDLIPGVQLPIPVINYHETMVYAWISAVLFVGIGIVKKLYELYKPVQKYFQTFTKVWIYRIITIAFIAYFGQGFLFFFGISRFIILMGSFFTFFVLFFFDQLWNYMESRKHKNSSNRIIIIGSDTLESYKAIEKVKR
jgi:FlaA1/EpsC-like NDP-sugar epimerase